MSQLLIENVPQLQKRRKRHVKQTTDTEHCFSASPGELQREKNARNQRRLKGAITREEIRYATRERKKIGEQYR